MGGHGAREGRGRTYEGWAQGGEREGITLQREGGVKCVTATIPLTYTYTHTVHLHTHTYTYALSLLYSLSHTSHTHTPPTHTHTHTHTHALCQVREHCGEDSLWVVYGGDVYDVTGFLREHPGGMEALLGSAWQVRDSSIRV